MPKYTWEKMQNDPQELRKLIETIEQIDGKSSDESDKRLENMLTQLRSLKEKPNQKNANQIFADNIEKLGGGCGIKHDHLPQGDEAQA